MLGNESDQDHSDIVIRPVAMSRVDSVRLLWHEDSLTRYVHKGKVMSSSYGSSVNGRIPQSS